MQSSDPTWRPSTDRTSPAFACISTPVYQRLYINACISTDHPNAARTARARTSAANWEYTAVQRLAIRDIAAFDAQHAAAIIGPSRALFRALGWMSDVE